MLNDAAHGVVAVGGTPGGAGRHARDAAEEGDRDAHRFASRRPWFHHNEIHVRTRDCLQFIDLTDAVRTVVLHSGIRNGIVNVQSMHTTAAIVVNENEPLLIEDMRASLDDSASRSRRYQHDQMGLRTVNVEPGERPNGHSHCKALYLRASETLNIVRRRVQLGRWQRIFFVELDEARERSVSVMVVGV